jgi:transmembrane sensor
MNAEEYLLLYEKYIAGDCSAEEEQRLFDYEDNFRLLSTDQTSTETAFTENSAKTYKRILATLSERQTKVFQLRYLLKIAAVLALAIGLGFFYQSYIKISVPKALKGKSIDFASRPIKPGRNTAELKLANGAVVQLDKIKDGVIAASENTKIRKLSTGSIEYSKAASSVDHAMNTITVPAGGNYKVILPDGTAVWLNSVSSLTYPVSFQGKSRNVILKGEAYFEVAKNPKMPFVVAVDEMRVTVLGTHFDVNAYPEQAKIKTTLLEGSVRLNQASSQVILSPGEQGIVDRRSSDIQMARVNINKVMGWKNGYFMFQDDNIKDIMQQIARWYDVDIEYRGNVQNKSFGGIYSKHKDIIELLKGLELTGLVHFKIEGRRIIVMA